MTDNFEKAKDDILKRTAGNGGPGPMDLLVAMGALAADHDNDHEESMGAMATLIDRLDTHQVEANVRDAEIADIQEWRRRSAEGCQERIEAIVRPLIDAGHERVHQHHLDIHQLHLDASHGGTERRKDDPPDVDFVEKRAPVLASADDHTVWEMLLGYSIAKRILWLVVGALIVFAISYGADSCSRANYWGSGPPAIVVSPSPTANQQGE